MEERPPVDDDRPRLRRDLQPRHHSLGHDRWQAEVQLSDGAKKGHYVSDVAHCTLHSADVGSTLTLSVGDTLFMTAASNNHDSVPWTTRP